MIWPNTCTEREVERFMDHMKPCHARTEREYRREECQYDRQEEIETEDRS